jgi:hypothetical protein
MEIVVALSKFKTHSNSFHLSEKQIQYYSNPVVSEFNFIHNQ